MDKTREALRVSIAFVRFKYREVAYAHGLKNKEFKDWAQSMAGLGVAIALDQADKYNVKRDQVELASHQLEEPELSQTDGIRLRMGRTIQLPAPHKLGLF